MNDHQPQTPPAAQPNAAQPNAAQPNAAQPNAAQLAELQQLIAELKERVSALRNNELDAATLEERLRELNELAVKAASAVDSASR